MNVEPDACLIRTRTRLEICLVEYTGGLQDNSMSSPLVSTTLSSSSLGVAIWMSGLSDWTPWT